MEGDINELLRSFTKCTQIFLSRNYKQLNEIEKEELDMFMLLYQTIVHEKMNREVKTKAAEILCLSLSSLSADIMITVAEAPLVLGSFVELGADPDKVAPHYIDFIKKFAAYFIPMLENIDVFQNDIKFSQCQQLAGYLGQAANAIFCGSQSALLEAQKDEELIKMVVKLRWEARFLHHVLVSPVNMEFYIFYLLGDAKFGCKVKISGISDNVQLNALMEDALAKDNRAECTPLPEHIKGCFDGTGNQQSNATFSPKFQLSTWPNLQSDLSLSESLSGAKFWIWGEGVPDDILPCPSLEGKRVILLGETKIHRTNNVSREFGPLKAQFEIIEYYDGDHCSRLLQKIADINPEEKKKLLEGELERTNVKNVQN